MDNNFNNKFINSVVDTASNNSEREFKIIPGGRHQFPEAAAAPPDLISNLGHLGPNIMEKIINYLGTQVNAAEQSGNESLTNFASINFEGTSFNLGKFIHLLNEVATAVLLPSFMERSHGPMHQAELQGQTFREESKKSFLVFRHNKYITVHTEQIAFVYVRNEASTIMTLKQEEYPIVPSLDQVQCQLCTKQFFRLNRQYLINFNAIKEVEHYFARKLLVKLVIPTPESLLISKEKTSSFLKWLENR